MSNKKGFFAITFPLTKLYETLVPYIRGLVRGYMLELGLKSNLDFGNPNSGGASLGRLGILSVVQNQNLASNSSVEGVEKYLIYNLTSHYVALNLKNIR